MAGIADMLFGGGAQAYSVPQPQVSMADILAGGVPAAAPGPAGSVATAFADSPAPGAVASAGQQANAAAAQEPGILDKARDWATRNPSAAQGLMQGFAALASGRTRGGFVQQLGQAAGVVNQTMVEQNAANAAQEQERQRYGTREQRAEEAHRNAIENRNTDNKRQDRQLDMQSANYEDQRKTNELNRRRIGQQLDEQGKIAPLKYKEATMRLAQLDEEIKNAPTTRKAAELRLQQAQLNFDLEKQYGPAEAQAKMEGARANADAAGSRADQEELQLRQQELTAAELAKLPPEQQAAYRLGIKPTAPKVPKTPGELAEILLTKEPDRFISPDGKIRTKELGEAVRVIQRGGDAAPATQQAWVAARDKVKVGQSYIGPDGREYIRKQ